MFSHNRKVERNYGLLSACAWYTPGISGIFMILGWFLVGMVVAGIVFTPFFLSAGDKLGLSYSMLLIYPLQYLPLLIYVRLKSSKDSFFERGYKLDSNHFDPKGFWISAILAILATLAASMMLDLANHYLPETKGTIMEQIEAMLKGPLWANLLTMAVFAPIFEEWMCRGVLLRGLLNFKHTGEESGERPRGMSPALAIVISALFFGAIHGNIWQGITAFAIGCLFGYVYYRTGSLKLVILMHCANNTLAVLASKFGGAEMEEAKSLVDLLPAWQYAILFVVSAIVLWLIIGYFRKVPLQDPQGNCDVIPSADDIAAAELAEKAAEQDAENI